MAKEGANELLLLSRRNEVFEILVRCGLAAHLSGFAWLEVRQRVTSAQGRGIFDRRYAYLAEDYPHGPLISRLEYKHGKHIYFFLFSGSGSPLGIGYFPDVNLGVTVLEQIPWSDVVKHVAYWATSIAHEVKSQDLWSEIDSEGERLIRMAAMDPSDRRRFSAEDIEHIREATTVFHQALLNRYEVPQHIAEEIKSRLDQLVYAAQQQSRSAWVQTAVGVIVSVALSISPQAGIVTSLLALFGQFLVSKRVLKLPSSNTIHVGGGA